MARLVLACALAACALLAGCQSGTQGTPVTSSGSPTEPSFPTSRPSTSRPTAAPPTKTAPSGPVSPPAAEVLPPDESGYVFIETKSGQTRCQLDEQSVGCEAPFTNTPMQDGVRANGVNLSADGNVAVDRRQPRRHPGRDHRLPHIQRRRLDDRGHHRRHPIHQPAHQARHVRQHRESRNLLDRPAH